MFPTVVVVVEPVCHVFGKFSSSFVCLQVDSLVFQGSPESLYDDVIPETPFAVHADFDVPGLEYGCECFAGKLAPLVSVEDFGGAVFEKSFFERFDTESCIQRVGYGPPVHPDQTA